MTSPAPDPHRARPGRTDAIHAGGRACRLRRIVLPGRNGVSPRFCLHLPLLIFLFASFTITTCNRVPLNGIEASGTIEVIDVTVSAKVPGEIEKRYVDEGSVVRVGDTLAHIHHLTADLELRQAEAGEAAAKAQYDLVLRGTRAEDLERARASMENAEADYHRAEKLFESDLISDKELSDAKTNYILAKEYFEKLKTGPLEEEKSAAKARFEEAAAQVHLIRKKLDDAWVISPANGIVTLRAVEVGEMVATGTAIVRVSVLEKVRLVIYVREADLGHIRIGQKARVTIDTYPDRAFDGTVIYVSPTAEFTPKNVQTQEERVKLSFTVKIEVENPDGELKPGMPADAFIPFGENAAH